MEGELLAVCTALANTHDHAEGQMARDREKRLLLILGEAGTWRPLWG